MLNVSLYLSARHGDSVNYYLVLSLYEANYDQHGQLIGLPLDICFRKVDDIMADDWYNFQFTNISSLSAGDYALVLHLQSKDPYAQVDFGLNFVDWFHSAISSPVASYSFSSNSNFAYGLNNFDFDANIYGYGYGYLESQETDYFDILDVDGNSVGYITYGYENYGYGYGIENISFRSNNSIIRNFKIYDQFNTLVYNSQSGLGITFPPSDTEEIIYNNRQNFVDATKTRTKIDGHHIVLSGAGERLYVCDANSFDLKEYGANNVDWFTANLFLSVNDLNYADICNPVGNENKYLVNLIAAPYFAGIYLSSDGGSTWSTQGLTGENISCAKISPGQVYVLAFNNSDTENSGKVYYSLYDSELSWIEISSLPKNVSERLQVYDCLFVSENEIWVATNLGIFKSDDSGATWSEENTGLDSNTVVRQIVKDSSDRLFIATNTGAYRYLTSWNKIYSQSTYSILATDDYIYLGISNGLLRSVSGIADGDTIEFQGDDIADTDFYAFGLNKQKVTKILSDASEVYVSQNGGVFISKNDGGNFTCISNKLNEKSVKTLLYNPLDYRIFYALTETTKFSRAAATIAIDMSGSMLANDPQGQRFSCAKKFINQLEAAAIEVGNNNFYQLVIFGLNEVDYQREIGGQAFSGVINFSQGYNSNAETIVALIDRLELTENYHYRTNLTDVLNVLMNSDDKNGSLWAHDDDQGNYSYMEIISKYHSELDRFLVVLTDGFNSVNTTTLDTNFSNMGGSLYLVGIGNNIDYEKLNLIKETHPNAFLYLAEYDENVYGYGYSSSEIVDYFDILHYGDNNGFVDVTEILLSKEKYRVRDGVWNKIFLFSEERLLKSVRINANVPTGTVIYYQVRASDDKDIWTDWEENLQPNVVEEISLRGKYFEIEIHPQSNYTFASPEIYEMIFNTTIPSESFVFSKIQTTTNPIRQLQFESLDDNSLSVVNEDDLKLDFGISQSKASTFNQFKSLKRYQRNLIGRKEYENITTDDGYFFYSEHGAWPIDATIELYDITNGLSSIDEPISSNSYSTNPSKGLVIFYKKNSAEKKFVLKTILPENQFRLGMRATNYTENEIDFNLKSIAFMYDEDSNSYLSRSALPYTASQLTGLNSYGFASPNTIRVGENLSATITLQYINKIAEYSNQSLSINHGYYLNLKTASGSDNYQFYNQNFALPEFYVNDSEKTNAGYVRMVGNIQQRSVSTDDNIDFNYQIDTIISSLGLGESISFYIGDTTLGGAGLPTWIKMQNLLHSQDDEILSEIRTYFYAQDGEEFDKVLSPYIEFGGNAATKFVIFAPTTLRAGTSFTFSAIAVDDKGFIDLGFTGSISLGISSSFGSLSATSYTFTSTDKGTKLFTGYVNSNATDFATVDILFQGNTYSSNPIVIESGTLIRWGDLNTSSILGEGRQDLDFIADYAKNISLLSFVGIADDISLLTASEWKYERYKANSLSTSGFYMLPGFRYRMSDNHGEHVVILDNAYEEDYDIDLPSAPGVISTVGGQFSSLTQALADVDYLAFPIHTAYDNQDWDDDDLNEIFANRSFDFNYYWDIMGYGDGEHANNLIKEFVNSLESSVEVYSAHGNIEDNQNYNNTNFAQTQASYYVKTALKIGKRFGFIANNGDYSSRSGYYAGDSSLFMPSLPPVYNKGLTALLENTLSSARIVEGIKNRKTYATTGARMYLNFACQTVKQSKTVIGSMGNIINDMEYYTSGDYEGLGKYSITFTIRAVADNSYFNRIQIIKIKMDGNEEIILDSRNTTNSVFNSSSFGQDTGELEFEDTDLFQQVVMNAEICYYVKVYQANGHIGWSSPIYFNYGRTDGVSSQIVANGKQISGVSLVTIGDSYGDINSIPAVFSGTTIFPLLHQNMLVSNNQPITLTRQTPYENKYLLTSNKKSIITGIRIFEDESATYGYGTHFIRYIQDDDPEKYFLDVDTNMQPPMNGSGLSDIKYKSLNDSNDPRNNFLRNKYYRNFLFGSMMQYNATAFNSTYALERDTVYTNSYKLVKDPFLFREDTNWYLFYSTYASTYPENSITKIDYSPAADIKYNRIEEFAGLLEDSNFMTAGVNFKIKLAKNTGLSGRNFALETNVPNLLNSTQIGYVSSPVLLKTSTGYNLYYLGWFIGRTSGNPVLAMFCNTFSDFNEMNLGRTYVCHVFSSVSGDYPFEYDQTNNRKSSFSNYHFMPYDLRTQENSWLNTHPAYALPWNWLSVVQYDSGVYYAFFNFMNKSSAVNGVDTPGTGIFYSLDGINFYEYDLSTASQNIPALSNILFAHPFKKSGSWQMIYRKVNGATNLIQNVKDWKLSYSKFDWIPKFTISA